MTPVRTSAPGLKNFRGILTIAHCASRVEDKNLKTSRTSRRHVRHHPTESVATGEMVLLFELEYPPLANS